MAGSNRVRFEVVASDQFLAALDRALKLWADPSAWVATVRRAMALDFSWDAAAAKYEALYKGGG